MNRLKCACLFPQQILETNKDEELCVDSIKRPQVPYDLMAL